MRIVRIADLSEEERKKALEEQEERYQENESNRKAEFKRVADLNTELRIQEKMDKVFNSAPIAENGYTSNKQENKNIWNDLKGIASNFTRSLGNLGINAYENVNRINGEYINQRNKLLEDTNNKYITKSLKDKGYSEQQIQELKNNSPTLESVANNSKVLNGITNSANKIIQPMENKFQEWENANNQKIQENIENASNPVSKKILELTPSIAQSSVNLIPGGNVLFSAGITQNYYEDAKQQKGMSDEEASKYASIMATLESATELVGARLTKNVGKALIKGNVKSALVNYGLDIGENFLEEAVMEPLNELTTTAVAGKEKADWENIGQRSLQAGIDGALTSILMGGASAGVGSAVNVVNKISNGQVVTQNEIQTAVKDTQNSGIVDVESILKDEMNNAINKSNLQQNQVNNENNIQTQQTMQEQNRMSQNQTSGQLNDILNNKELPMQSYQYELSDNVKVNNLRQDANKYFNNSEKAKNYVSMLEKIITDKNIDIRLDANLKTADGRIANGSYSNGVITINPNSTRAGEFIAIHELTHAIGTKEMLNMINTYRQSNVEFDTVVKGLLQNYQGTEISEEALSDISAQLFGNQEFINNIAQNNPNIFQKLYSEIKYLWHQFRGYKNQNQFVEDLYYKWTQAYNSNNKLNSTSNYSIAGIKAVNNIQNNSNLYNQAINNYNQANTMANQGINNELIRQNTGWFQDKNGDWKFEFSDKHMSLKNMKYEEGKIYELGNILNHNELFMFYPELAKYNIEFIKEKNSKKKAKYDNDSKTISINSQLLNKNNAQQLIEGTLIHEIQHVIQHMEGYETGKSSFSKLAYYNSLGEIEADNIKTRFIDEKYNNKNISNIAPESSKNNPKHRGLDNYIQNKTTLDKIKDGIYNYFKSNKGEYDYEINQEITSQDKEENNSKMDVGRRINEQENSNKSSFSMDNQGRTLTKEQQEYFKDSKVRDENGNLKTLYHGTPYDFNVFSYEKLGENTSSLGAGLYFTDSQKTGKEYTRGNGNLKEVYVDIQKPMSYGKTTMTKKEYKNFIEKINKETNGTYLSDYDGIDNAIMEYEYGGDDIDLVNAVHNASGLSWKKTYEILRETTGFDGIISDKGFLNDGEIIYVAFNSNQIKNVSNTNPTDNPDIRYSQNNETWQSYLDKNYKATGTRTNLQDIKLPTAQKQVAPTAENNILPTGEYTKQNGINQNIQIRTEKQIANDKSISDLQAIQEASRQVDIPSLQTITQIENNLNREDIEKSPTIDYIKKKRSKEKISLKEIKDTLAQRFINKGHYIDKLANKTQNKKLTFLYDRTMNTFNEAQISIGDYQINSKGEIVGKSIIDIFQPSIDAGLELEFEDYLLNKHNISRYAYEKGLYGKEISSIDSADIVLKYENLHPEFKKWSEEVNKYNDNNLKDLVSNGMISQDTYNKLKSMYGNYVPTFRDIVENISQYEDNSVGSNPIKKATQSNKNILSIKESMAEQTLIQKKAIRMNNLGLELYKTLGKDTTILEGIEVDPIAIQTIAGDVIEKATDGTNIFTIFRDGEMIQFKISDELYTAFSKDTLQNKINNSQVAKALLMPIEKLSKAQRELLTTYSIGFSMTNPIKDFGYALFTTKYSDLRFIKNYTKALYNIATNGKWYQNYKNNGGTANTYFDYEKGLVSNKNKKFRNKIKIFNNVLEQAPRLAEYISTIEKGGSIDEALYNASDITVNFKRGGDITKAVNKYGVNFLNASVQGLDKIYRDLTQQNGWKGYSRLITRATILQIAPAIINSLALGDDDDYEDLPEYIKDNYYLFKMGDGKFFRIPKDRLSSVIGGIARRSLETIQGKEVDWKSIVNTTTSQLAPNNPFTDNILAPIIQASNNKAWYGGNIVNSTLQKLPTTEQYDESTDKFSKWLGEKLNISPKKINYVLDQYSGGIGDAILPILTPQAENNIFEDKFTTDAIIKNKNVSKYYSQLEELEKKNNSINATDEEKLKYKYFSNTLSDISDLYKEKRSIQNSDLSDEEKKKQVKELQKQINYIVEEKLNTVENIKINSNTAIVGKSEYYKTTNIKDETKSWKELSEEEAKKNKNISLTTYADYKEKIAQKTIKQRKNGDIKEDENLKNKDKILILINANYSNKEKQALYENYIKETTDKKYEIVKSVEKFNINSYLDYKLAESNGEFKADRKDDGTESGTAIRSGEGSSKNKKYNYILSMKDTSYMQKVILFGLENTPEKSDKATIVNYIMNIQGKNNTEKKEMLKQFSWIKWYKDGTFDY